MKPRVNDRVLKTLVAHSSSVFLDPINNRMNVQYDVGIIDVSVRSFCSGLLWGGISKH